LILARVFPSWIAAGSVWRVEIGGEIAKPSDAGSLKCGGVKGRGRTMVREKGLLHVKILEHGKYNAKCFKPHLEEPPDDCGAVWYV
jgi:hypothetical protein